MSSVGVATNFSGDAMGRGVRVLRAAVGIAGGRLTTTNCPPPLPTPLSQRFFASLQNDAFSWMSASPGGGLRYFY